MWKNMLHPDMPQWRYITTHALCMLDNRIQTYTQRMYACFPRKKKRVSRTRPNVTLCVL